MSLRDVFSAITFSTATLTAGHAPARAAYFIYESKSSYISNQKLQCPAIKDNNIGYKWDISPSLNAKEYLISEFNNKIIQQAAIDPLEAIKIIYLKSNELCIGNQLDFARYLLSVDCTKIPLGVSIAILICTKNISFNQMRFSFYLKLRKFTDETMGNGYLSKVIGNEYNIN